MVVRAAVARVASPWIAVPARAACSCAARAIAVSDADADVDAVRMVVVIVAAVVAVVRAAARIIVVYGMAEPPRTTLTVRVVTPDHPLCVTCTCRPRMSPPLS